MNITNHVINPSENFMNETLKSKQTLHQRGCCKHTYLKTYFGKKERNSKDTDEAVKVPVNSIRVI